MPTTIAAPAERKYLLERVGEAAVVQVYADAFRDLPLREQIDTPVREQLIIELYSK